MAGMNILATGSCLPERTVTNEELSHSLDTSDEWIRSRTGIAARHIAEGQTTAGLAAQAARCALKKAPAGFDVSEIGLIVCATITPDDHTPGCACQVQKELGLDGSVLAFDVNGACSGFVMALQIALSMLEDGQTALVIGAERLSSILDWSDRSTCVLFGDGAGALLVQKDSRRCVKAYARTLPDKADLLRAPASGAIAMKGSGVFRFAVKAFSEIYEHCVETEGPLKNRPDAVICHQANLRIMEKACRSHGLGMDCCFVCLDHTGNTAGASIPIALDEAISSGFLQRGIDTLLTAFGSGLSMAGLYFRY